MYKKFFIGAVVALAVCVALCGCDMFDYLSMFDREKEVEVTDEQRYAVKAGKYVAESIVSNTEIFPLSSFEIAVEKTELTDAEYEALSEKSFEETDPPFARERYVRNKDDSSYYFVEPAIALGDVTSEIYGVFDFGDSCKIPLEILQFHRDGKDLPYTDLTYYSGFYTIELTVKVTLEESPYVTYYELRMTFNEGGTEEDMPVSVDVTVDGEAFYEDAYTFRLKYKSA